MREVPRGSAGSKSFLQVRTLLLIAMLALTRKLISIDLETLVACMRGLRLRWCCSSSGALLWPLRSRGRAG
jgi:hypothetical protein